MTWQKFDSDKTPLGLVDPCFIEEVAQVLHYGAYKYSPGNWIAADTAKRHYEALDRHFLAMKKGEVLDEESGLTHAAHAACNMMFIMFHNRNFPRETLMFQDKAGVAPFNPDDAPYFVNKTESLK
jgi:hypothetical protein